MTKAHHQGKSTTSRSPVKFAKRLSMTYSRRELDLPAECGRAIKCVAIVVSLALGPPDRAIAGTIPADDAVVLAVLPTALLRHRESSSGAASEPRDAAEALQLVRVYLDADADSGDARYLDRAENLLDTWSMKSTAELPIAVLMARAEVAQRAHRFDEARAALDTVLERAPDHAQARVTRAYVLMAQGESRAALEDCNSLRGASVLSAVNCVCRAQGLTGEAGRAYEDVKVALNRAKRGAVWGDAELFELSLTAADLAERLGLNDEAATHHRFALALAPKSAFAQSAYADFLLLRGDAATAYALIAADDERLGLQVRRAIAAKQLGHTD